VFVFRLVEYPGYAEPRLEESKRVPFWAKRGTGCPSLRSPGQPEIELTIFAPDSHNPGRAVFWSKRSVPVIFPMVPVQFSAAAADSRVLRRWLVKGSRLTRKTVPRWARGQQPG